jgi:hypothetical protein
MPLVKTQAEGINLADTFAFTGDVSGVGVSNLQFWRINSSVTATTTPTVLTNWTDSHNTNEFKRIGTAWSVSSGVFTPSTTGLYQITFVADISNSADARYIQFDYDYSTNSGSSYTALTMYCFLPFVGSNNTYGEFTFPRYFNISDASTFRFRVKFSGANTSQTLRGGADNSISHLSIIRLADAQ